MQKKKKEKFPQMANVVQFSYRIIMKKTIFILLSMITIHANAQFSYSIKVGWSQPFF